MVIIAALTGILLIVYLTMSLLFLVGLFIPSQARSADRPFVSILIAARNEQDHIIACLESAVRQSYPKDKFEVIVIDDRSTDGTYQAVSQFSSLHPQIKLLHISSKPKKLSGKKNALDAGIKVAEGEILLFTDADCRVKNTWVEGMVSHFNSDVGAVIGFSAIESNNIFERWQEYDFLALMSATCGITNIGFPLAASGQNLAYRRKAFDSVGGFQTIKERISGDDTLMIQLIRKNTKYKTVFASQDSTFNITRPTHTLKEFIHQRSRWASNGIVMLRMNPAFFLYLIDVYALHLLLVAGLLVGMIHLPLVIMTLFAWISKGIVDFAVTFSGARQFKMKFSHAYFLWWFLLQTPLILWVGLKGSLGLFKWK